MRLKINIPVILILIAVSVLLLCFEYDTAALFGIASSVILIGITYTENKHLSPAELLPIVVLSVAASVGRTVFNFIPQIQPVTAIVITAGVSLGKRAGMLTGILCALVSNLFLGQGPWTVLQIIAWGLIGFAAGLFPHMKLIPACFFGFVAGFLHGFITDIWTILYFGESLTMKTALSVYGAGMVFNLLHAVGNVIFLLLLYEPLKKRLGRVSQTIISMCDMPQS